MKLLASMQPWTCVCGAVNTSARCNAPDHEAGKEWAAHLARVRAREALLPPAPEVPAGDQARICAGCTEERWLPPDGLHCVECLALARRPNNHERKWSPAEEAMLREDWGLRGDRGIAERLFRAGFQPRTATSVKVHGKRICEPKRQAKPQLWTRHDLCEALQVSRHVVQEARLAGLITPVSSAGALLFGDEAYETLARIYPPPPERSISAPEAARLLGFNRHHVDQLARHGGIRGVFRGMRWYLDADHVDELVAAKGEGRMQWGIGVVDRCALAKQAARRERREARRAGKITAREAAARLGTCAKTIGRLVAAGLLDAEKEYSTRWLIDADQVEVLELHPDLLRESLEAAKCLA